MLFTYSTTQKRRVHKRHSHYGLPWLVTNHPAGPMVFATWREAMDYATAQMFLINGAA